MIAWACRLARQVCRVKYIVYPAAINIASNLWGGIHAGGLCGTKAA
jgi:hypothetical protein